MDKICRPDPFRMTRPISVDSRIWSRLELDSIVVGKTV